MRQHIRERIERAKLLIRRQAVPARGGQTDEERLVILKGLLELQKQGKIDGVWYDDFTRKVSVKRTKFGEILPIGWAEAARMIARNEADSASASLPALTEVVQGLQRGGTD